MIRQKRPDYRNAISMVDAAKREMGYTLKMLNNPESASTIARNIYENFRMLGDALLMSKGKIIQDHAECVRELIKLNVKTERPLGNLENLRILRHNINYYGYQPTAEEVHDAISIAKACFQPLYDSVKKQILSNDRNLLPE